MLYPRRWTNLNIVLPSWETVDVKKVCVQPPPVGVSPEAWATGEKESGLVEQVASSFWMLSDYACLL